MTSPRPQSRSWRKKLTHSVFDYMPITGKRLGRTQSKEQYAYMYRVGVVEEVESFTYQDPQDDFHREPFIAHFKIINKSFDFILVTIHTDPDEATAEINKIPDTINAIVAKVDDAAGPRHPRVTL